MHVFHAGYSLVIFRVITSALVAFTNSSFHKYLDILRDGHAGCKFSNLQDYRELAYYQTLFSMCHHLYNYWYRGLSVYVQNDP